MKKVIALLLVYVMCLGLCACDTTNNSTADSPNSTADSSIELTLSNCEQYLDIAVSTSSYGDGSHYYNDVTYIDFGYFYDGVEFDLTVNGASPNYNYSNVVVTVNVAGEYAGMSRDYDGELDIMDSTPFTFDMTAVSNVAGDGDSSYIFKAPSPYKINKDDYMISSYEIVSVSGTVTPV